MKLTPQPRARPSAHAASTAASTPERTRSRPTVPEPTAAVFALNAARALRNSGAAGERTARTSSSRLLLCHTTTSGHSPLWPLDVGVRPDVFVPPAHRVGYGGFFSTYSVIRLQDLRESLRSELQEESARLGRLSDRDCLLSIDDRRAEQHVLAFEEAILGAARSAMMAAGAAEAVVLMRRRARGEPLERDLGRRHRGHSRGQPRHPSE